MRVRLSTEIWGQAPKILGKFGKFQLLAPTTAQARSSLLSSLLSLWSLMSLQRRSRQENLGTGPENPWKIRKIPVIGSGSGTGAKLSLAVAFVPLVSYVPSKGTRDLRDTRDKRDDISRRLRTKISRAIGTRQSGAEPQLMPSLGSLWSLLSLQRLSKQKKKPYPPSEASPRSGCPSRGAT